MYLKQRHLKWWAFHDIPKDLRLLIGVGVRFAANLDTSDRKTADNRAAALEVQWRRQIEAARQSTKGQAGSEAAWWNTRLQAAGEKERPLIVDRIKEEAQEIALAEVDPFDPDLTGYSGNEAANRFYEVATGKMTRYDAHLDDWIGTLRNEQKSIDMKRSNVKKFAQAFPYVQDVKRRAVQEWINKQVEKEGKKPATIQRMLSELRGYWGYLISVEVAADDALPFERLSLPRANAKETHQDKRRAFSPKDVVRLLKAAEKAGDEPLADLIRLGMWTGARLEELCALKITEATAGKFVISDAKTTAGIREIPIHPKLLATVRRMKKGSKDGFLLTNLLSDKYGDRSPAIGKRFGRLKGKLGFGPQHVFHSIRKTVITLFENAEVPENVAMDIVGHEKPTLTYGHYSDGNSFEVMRRALRKVDYPGYVSR